LWRQGGGLWLDPRAGRRRRRAGAVPLRHGAMGGVYMAGADEAAGLSCIAQYGIPVLASDWFDKRFALRRSHHAGCHSAHSACAAAPEQVYVSHYLMTAITLQYMQHYMKKNWWARGARERAYGLDGPTAGRDLDPAMLNYYWSTATTTIAWSPGPSGAGYTRLNYWNPGQRPAYTDSVYLQRSGMRSITVWERLSRATTYALARKKLPDVRASMISAAAATFTNYGTLPVVGSPAR